MPFKNPAGIVIRIPKKNVLSIRFWGSGNLSDLMKYKAISTGVPTVKKNVSKIMLN